MLAMVAGRHGMRTDVRSVGGGGGDVPERCDAPGYIEIADRSDLRPPQRGEPRSLSSCAPLCCMGHAAFRRHYQGKSWPGRVA